MNSVNLPSASVGCGIISTHGHHQITQSQRRFREEQKDLNPHQSGSEASATELHREDPHI